MCIPRSNLNPAMMVNAYLLLMNFASLKSAFRALSYDAETKKYQQKSYYSSNFICWHIIYIDLPRNRGAHRYGMPEYGMPFWNSEGT